MNRPLKLVRPGRCIPGNTLHAMSIPCRITHNGIGSLYDKMLMATVQSLLTLWLPLALFFSRHTLNNIDSNKLVIFSTLALILICPIQGENDRIVLCLWLLLRCITTLSPFERHKINKVLSFGMQTIHPHFGGPTPL